MPFFWFYASHRPNLRRESTSGLAVRSLNPALMRARLDSSIRDASRNARGSPLPLAKTQAVRDTPSRSADAPPWSHPSDEDGHNHRAIFARRRVVAYTWINVKQGFRPELSQTLRRTADHKMRNVISSRRTRPPPDSQRTILGALPHSRAPELSMVRRFAPPRFEQK